MVDLLTDIRVDAAQGEAVLYRREGRTRSIDRVEFRPHLRCAPKDVAEAPAVRAVASVMRLAGDEGFRWRLEPRFSSNLFDVEAAVVSFASMSDGKAYSSCFDVPHVERDHLPSAFLMKSGMRVFDGAEPADVRVMALALEIGDERIVAAAVHAVGDPSGHRRRVAHHDDAGEEAKLLVWCVEQIRALDADIIVVEKGTDTDPIGDLLERCDELKVPCLLGADHEEPESRRGTDVYRIPGRQVVPLGSGVTAEATVEERAVALAGRAQDALPAWLRLASIFPRRLDELVRWPAAAVDAALIAAHENHDHTVPARSEKSEIEGPRAYLRGPGLYRDVHHLDLDAAYPTVITELGITPAGDQLSAFPEVVGELLSARRELQAAGNQRGAKVLKGFLSSASGYLNSDEKHFTDGATLQRVYDETSQILHTMIDVVEQNDGEVLWHQTDGLLFRGADPRVVHEELSEELGQRYPFRHEGPFSVLLINKMCRVLRPQDGTPEWKGNLLGKLNKRASLFGAFKAIVEKVLAGDDDAAATIAAGLKLEGEERDLWSKTVARLRPAFGAGRITRVFGDEVAKVVEHDFRAAGQGAAGMRAIQRAGLDAAERLRSGGEAVALPPCVRGFEKVRAKGGTPSRELRAKARAEREVHLQLAGSASRDRAEAAEDQPTVRCGHPALGRHCNFADCYRGQVSDLFDDDAATLAALENQVRPRLRAELRRAPPLKQLKAIEAMCRSGKTYQAAETAAALVAAGFTVHVIVPTHEAGRVFMRYLKNFWHRGSGHRAKSAVHVYGHTGEHCPLPRGNCIGCPRQRLKGLRSDRRAGTFEIDQLVALGNKSGTCARLESWCLAKHADLLVFTHAALVHEGSRRLLPKAADFTFVEEGDQLADSMQSKLTSTLTLAWSGPSGKRPLGDGTACTSDCARCQLSFPTSVVETDSPYEPATLTADREAATFAGLVGRLVDGLEVLEEMAGADAAAVPIDLPALRKNVEALVDAVGTVGGGGTPRERLVDLGPALVASGYARPNGLVDDPDQPEGQPVLLPLEPCLPDGVDRLRNVLDHLASWPGNARDAGSLAVAVAEFTHLAATRAGGALLSPKPRPGEWATHQPSCRLELSYFDTRAAQTIRGRLERSRTTLLSGTMGEREVAARRLFLTNENLDLRRIFEPMHRGFTVVMHTRGPGGAHQPSIPRNLGDEGIRDLVCQIQAHMAPGRVLRVLVFTPKKSAAKALFGVLAKGASAGTTVELVDGARRHSNQGSETRADVKLIITIDYLRSSGSRAGDRDFDVIMITGRGLPNYANSHAYIAAINDGHDDSFTPLDIAGDNRMRTIIQAMMRHAGLEGGPRLVLTLNDLAPHDLPDYLRTRALSAHHLYRKLGQDAVADRQVEVLAAECARLLEGHPPRRDGHRLGDRVVRGWRPREQLSAKTKLTMFRVVLTSTVVAQTVMPKDLAGRHAKLSGRTGTWRSLLDWLVVEDLVEVSKCRPRTYRGTRQSRHNRISRTARRLAHERSAAAG